MKGNDSIRAEMTELERRLAETKATNQNASSAAAAVANNIELKSANKEMARKLSEVQQQLEASKVSLKEEKSRCMSLIVEKNEQTTIRDVKIDSLEKEKAELERNIAEKQREMKEMNAQMEEERRRSREALRSAESQRATEEAENKRRSNHSSNAAVERLTKDKESLEKRLKEATSKWEESKENLEEAEERIEEMERRVAAAKQTEREKDDRHERLMAKLKELEKKNFELLETAKMAETFKQVSSLGV